MSRFFSLKKTHFFSFSLDFFKKSLFLRSQRKPVDFLVFFGKAEVAHLVEHDLAKVGVAGSSPVFRSNGKSL